MIEENDFTRVNNDVNGNPRYVLHFLKCEPEKFKPLSLLHRYSSVVALMKKIGGKKYHNRSYGGGIAFVSYNLKETIASIEEVKNET